MPIQIYSKNNGAIWGNIGVPSGALLPQFDEANETVSFISSLLSIPVKPSDLYGLTDIQDENGQQAASTFEELKTYLMTVLFSKGSGGGVTGEISNTTGTTKVETTDLNEINFVVSNTPILTMDANSAMSSIGESRFLASNLAIEATNRSLTPQNPSGFDTEMNINFGAAQDNNLINLSATGLITFKQSGWYEIFADFNFGRAVNNGTAHLFGYARINGAILPGVECVYENLTNSRSTATLFTFFQFQAFAGLTLSFHLIRDSGLPQANNDGGLYTIEPTVVANADPAFAGLQASPQAKLTIRTNNGFVAP